MGALETRRGFSFQDQYACLLFLKKLNSGEISELYTEYNAPTGRNIDIKLVTRQASEEYHEVKCGAKIRRSAAELSDTLTKFYELWVRSGRSSEHDYTLGLSEAGFRYTFYEIQGYIAQVRANPTTSSRDTKQALAALRAQV